MSKINVGKLDIVRDKKQAKNLELKKIRKKF